MKKNILVRILAGLGGVTLWLLGLGALAETFFALPLTGTVGQLLAAGTPVTVLVILLAVILLFAFGTCCLMMLSSRRAAKRKGFVMQKGENGMIGVSVKSIEGLVHTCVKQHDAIVSADVSVVERRDGIVILLNIEEEAGVNIPLAVGALQKQIKQYVNTCTGVDVLEVRVMVENTERAGAESPYMVEKPAVLPNAAVDPQREDTAEAAAPGMEASPAAETPAEEPPVQEAPAEEVLQPVPEEAAAPVVNVPVVAVAPVMPEIMEEDDRPLHQRLFGAEEQPAFVPAPPELVIEPGEETIPVQPEAQEAAPQTVPAEEEIDANAVLEVVEAIDAEAAEMQSATPPEADGEIPKP